MAGGITRHTSLPSNYKSMSVAELQNLKRSLPSHALSAFGKPTMMAQELDRTIAAAQSRGKSGSSAAPAPAAGGASSTPSGVPKGVSSAFERALSELSGTSADMEKTYQRGRRRAMSQAAIESINAGAANTLNLPAYGIAYDEAVRPQMNTQLAMARANTLQGLGGIAAGIYGTDVGASTSRYATDVGAETSRYGADLGFGASAFGSHTRLQTQRGNQALQKYIADLTAQYNPEGLSV